MNTDLSNNIISTSIAKQDSMNLVIVGLGLIGGSLAMALKATGFSNGIVGIDNNSDVLEKALSMGIIDESYLSISEIESNNIDHLVLATPVNTFEKLALECKKYLKDSTTISDVGSTKQNLLDAFTKAYGALPAQLVPAHPIAGRESSGLVAATANLFESSKVILLPLQSSAPDHLQKVRELWTKVNCTLVEMSVANHDRVLAKTSHLPHLLSFVMVHYLAGESDNYDIFNFSAGGLRDLTRMAASDPIMWSSIFCANKKNILDALDGLDSTISTLRTAIEKQDEQAMKLFIEKAREARNHYAKLLSINYE